MIDLCNIIERMSGEKTCKQQSINTCMAEQMILPYAMVITSMAYKSGIFSNLGKIMGMQDIEIGYEEFDDRYIIKGSNEEWVKKLFQNSRVRSLIQTQPKMSLEIKKGEGVFGPKFKEKESELYFLVPGVLKDVELLKKLFELFSEVIEELERMNITSTQSTDVNLY